MVAAGRSDLVAGERTHRRRRRRRPGSWQACVRTCGPRRSRPLQLSAMASEPVRTAGEGEDGEVHGEKERERLRGEARHRQMQRAYRERKETQNARAAQGAQSAADASDEAACTERRRHARGRACVAAGREQRTIFRPTRGGVTRAPIGEFKFSSRSCRLSRLSVFVAASSLR